MVLRRPMETTRPPFRHTWDNETDHTFHEVESIEYTDEAANSPVAFEEFITAINHPKIIIFNVFQ